MRTVKVYASTINGRIASGRNNFGDNLMAPLLRHLFSLEPVFVRLSQAELIGAGSILDRYYRHKGSPPKLAVWQRRPWRSLHVWGSGFIREDSLPIWPQRLVVHAVRGELSRRRIASPAEHTIALGDPGILLPLIWESTGKKHCQIAIVPHFANHQVFLSKYESILPKNWRVVDLLENPEDVTRQIDGAEFVISSSLHGLIAADAYGVPSCWMAPLVPIKGDGFKFADYFSFRGSPILGPIIFDDFLRNPARHMSDDGCRPVRPSAQIITDLLRAFPEF